MKKILFTLAAVTGAALFATADSAEAGQYYNGRTTVPVRSNYDYVQYGDHLHAVSPVQNRYRDYRPATRYRSNYLPGRTVTPRYNSRPDHYHRGYVAPRRNYVQPVCVQPVNAQPVCPVTPHFGLNIYR